MKRRIKQVLIALVISWLASNNSIANENVIVDLSVLDNLDINTVTTSYSSQKPLFPIVKKQPKIKKKDIKKQAVAKKTKPHPQPKSQQELKKQDVIEKKQEQPKQIPFVESNEDVVVVDVEPVTNHQQVKQMSPSDNQEKMPNMEKESVVEQQLSANETPNTSSNTVEKDSKSAPTLLVDENKVAPTKTTSTLLIFSPDVDQLTPEQQNQIDLAIANFENPIQNKIAIYAYNLDDGIDTFKKKRISLNRAVAVRSYLLPKGYKNFSIKVINIDETINKANMVELEELKN